ncbi:MAG: hypothetical protein ACI9MR_000329 [Myxococcota bacterium]|jgi:hypothetical protein
MSEESPHTEPTCKCGHARDADEVITEVRYSFMGMFTLFFGVTARPTSIDFICTLCRETVVRARDQATISAHTK